MGNILRLERFDRPEPAAVLHTAEDLQDAFAEGVIAGRDQMRAEQADALHAALAGVAADLAAMQAVLADASAAQARTLGPLIGALIDGVLPVVARARLESALLSAFVHLAETVTPLRVRLRCGPDLADFVGACLREVGVEALSLEADAPNGTVTADLEGGTMSWDEAAVAAQLRALVHELLQEP